MSTRKNSHQYSVGSIIAIPLSSHGYAYACVFNDWTLGIYDYITPALESAEALVRRKISFYVGSSDRAIKSGAWPLIGSHPFSSPDDAWAPPHATCYVRETNEWTMGGVPRVDHKGATRIATQEEVAGLDIMTVCPRPEAVVRMIVDRLVNGNHAQYKVRSP